MEIIVKLTTGCNLHCVYCSEGDKPLCVLKQEYLHKLINELPIFLGKHHDHQVTLLWHGGEPMTVGVPYLREAMEYARNVLHGYDVKFQMQSNLTLLDEAWIRLIQEFHIGIGVSLDGYKELHDANRLAKDGSLTFDVVLRNMEKLRQNGIHFGTLMVLNTEQHIDIGRLYEFIKEGNLFIKIHSVIPCGRAAGNQNAGAIYERYVDILEALYARAMEDEEFDATIEPIYEMLQAILTGCSVGECSYNGTCGEGIFCLYATGEMGFCGRAEVDGEDLCYGHVRDCSLDEIYESAHAQLIRSRQQYLVSHDCAHCPDWNLCHGGCTFEALNAYGTIYAKYPNCEGRRRFIHFLKTTGLDLLKKRLVRERKKYRIALKARRELLEELGHEK